MIEQTQLDNVQLNNYNGHSDEKTSFERKCKLISVLSNTVALLLKHSKVATEI